MSVPRRPGPVLVGVNDEPSSDLALHWAISDARTLGIAVKVVYAFSGTSPMREPMYRDIPDADLQEPRHLAEQLIARIIDQAREIDPEVVVEGETIEGGPSRVLVQKRPLRPSWSLARVS
jgi:nucleotide-binding universal stress UspA family protein